MPKEIRIHLDMNQEEIDAFFEAVDIVHESFKEDAPSAQGLRFLRALDDLAGRIEEFVIGAGGPPSYFEPWKET